MFLRGMHTFKENDLKAYLPQYGVKALNKNTINFLIFTHCCEGNRCRAKLQHLAVILLTPYREKNA